MIKPNKISDSLVSEVMPLIESEYDAFYHYRALTNWCRGVGYNLAADFFEKESQDELEHAKVLERYLVDWNVIVKLPVVESPKVSFADLVAGISDSYKMEYDLYQLYQKKVKKVFDMDVALFGVLQERLEVQLKAVIEYSDKLNMLEGVELTKTNLLLLESKLF